MTLSKNNTTPLSKTSSTKLVFDGNMGGCGNITVHALNKEGTIGVSVVARKDALGLSTEEKKFTIGDTEGLSVELSQGNDVQQFYCNDVIDASQQAPKKTIAKVGTVTIKVSDSSMIPPGSDSRYTATVTLHDVYFVDENNNEIGMIENLVFKEIVVGWLPG